MNFSNSELKVRDLIKSAYDENIWLPEFQRPFVWDKNQVRLLIDSLYHDYTISSILLWTGGDELARRRIGANIKQIKIPEDKIERVVYLLDGQQRTTALTLAFTDKPMYRGNNIKKKEEVNIYYDSLYQGEDPELRWVLEDEKIQDESNPGKMFMLKDFTEKEIFTQFKTRFVKLKHAYNFNDMSVENWFEGEDAELQTMTFLYNYNKQLKDLESHILERRVYDIEQKGSLEQVLEVFERINTKNTKLSIFDIMVAKTYRNFSRGYFDLRTYYKIVNYKDSIQTDYFDNLDQIDLDRVEMLVEEGFMLQLSMIILNKKFKATEILKLKTVALIDNAKHLHDKFHFLIDFLNFHFRISKEELNVYQPIMKFLAAALSYYSDVNFDKQEFLKRWFWNTLLKNRYPGAQNERIAKDFKTIEQNSDSTKALEIMIRDNTRSYDYLDNISLTNFQLIDAHYSNRSQQIYRALLLLLKSKDAKDFYNGLVAVKSGAAPHRLEEHHIFPKSSSLGKDIIEKYKNHRYNDVINNIANISLITNNTNNKRIKNKLPGDYVTDFELQYINAGKSEEFLRIMESQFISPEMIEMLKNNDFENFILARTRLLHSQIERLCEIV